MSNNHTVTKQLREDLRPYCWKPGQSGNPNGRPKVKVPSEYARDYLQTVNPKKGKINAQVLGESWVDEAIRGNGVARKELIDRIEGPVAQTYQIEKTETYTIEYLIELRNSIPDKGVLGDTPQDMVGDSIPAEIVKGDKDE